MPSNIEDVVNQVEDAMSGSGGIGASFSWEKLIYIVVLIAAGLVIIKVLLKLADRGFRRLDIDPGIKRFLRSGLRIILLFILAIIVLSSLNISITSLVAVLSVAGLALSLAIQNLLSNVAGGLQLLSTKPFGVGDYIEAGGVSGAVSEMGMFYTKLKTVDNKLVQVPNSEIAGEKIVNYSAEENRRVEWKVSASYDAPIERVKQTIQQVLGEHPKTLATPEPVVRVNAYGSSAIEYVVRVWCANEDYWDVYCDVLEEIKHAFDRAGIEMPYSHLNVHLYGERREDSQ